MNESRYHIATTFLTLLGRALAEVGAVSIVGGAIMFKTNVMTTAIMDYIRSRLLPNDSELAGDRVNESLLTDLKNRLSRDFLPDEKIMPRICPFVVPARGMIFSKTSNVNAAR